jgi:hypothetical protein
VKELEARDDTWRAKKAMLENDLGKAWERIALLEKVAEYATHRPDCTQKTRSYGCTCKLKELEDALRGLKGEK